ncbi:uncharacterized protein LOC114531907 [Dendronephthya gigantea]|uniref:uncharacterized protein LOC114531907 n=1 Tax=Dendronephthya gigantea TaxID=151771 RepID=UPI001069106B|nr:uncharacterized protein LOC114531907 [Dendronephthya gigantea]
MRTSEKNIVIKNDEVLRLRSSGGRFVSITETKAASSTQDSTTFIVAATEEQQPSTNIEFHEVDPFEKLFVIKFEKEDSFYKVDASESSVTAAKIPDKDAAHFTYYELDPPNKPYFVFPCLNRKIDNHDAYLSCDGAGNMSLKRWNLAGNRRLPPKAGAMVDPSLLFRVVKPLNNE